MAVDRSLMARAEIHKALVGVVTAVGLMLAAGQAHANDLIVHYDQSSLLRLPRNVAEVIIGNPSIADVSVQGGNMLVVTGKTFGITNVIALDADHNVIQDQRVIVERDEANIVNLIKAGARQSYTCTRNCSPTLTIGDDPVFYDAVQKSATSKTKFSDSGDGGGQQGNQ